jgi:hypothetical protein
VKYASNFEQCGGKPIDPVRSERDEGIRDGGGRLQYTDA